MTDRSILRTHNVTVLGNAGSDCTLVFVHGFGTHRGVWHEVAAPFLPDCRVVLLDNAGASGMPDDSFAQHRYLNLQAYARDLVEVGRALHLRGAVLVGHSAGAMIALLAARADPRLASRLVLIGASPRYLNAPGYPGGLEPRDIEAIYGAVQGYEKWAERYAAAAMGNPERPQLARRLAESLTALPPHRALTVLCSILQSDHRDDLRHVHVPTLVVQSRDDVAVPLEVAQYLARHIPGARLEVINATGHLPHVSAPAEVVRVIRDFLQPGGPP